MRINVGDSGNAPRRTVEGLMSVPAGLAQRSRSSTFHPLGALGQTRGPAARATVLLQQRILLRFEADFRQSVPAPDLPAEPHPAETYPVSLGAATRSLQALAVDEGQDFFSPQATADRIVDLVRSLFPAFRERHPELTDAEAVEVFHEVAASGVLRGAQDARNLLGTLPAPIAWQVHETVELTLSGLDQLAEELMVQAAPGSSQPAAPAWLLGSGYADSDAPEAA